MTRLVDRNWGQELDDALRADPSDLRIICPFIKLSVAQRLLAVRPGRIRVITRFNLNDFAQGVSDVAALSQLLEAGAVVRGVRGLHAKSYVFGCSCAMVTSANLTHSALNTNHEFGLVSGEAAVIAACQKYFDELWSCAGPDLSAASLAEWSAVVFARRTLSRSNFPPLPDHGAELGAAPGVASASVPFREAGQGFVKFLGRSADRAPASLDTAVEIERAGCHWALTYPTSKRPWAVEGGALMFISRLTRDPPDIHVFGRALGVPHVPGRDEASTDEISVRPWKADWKNYIRVYDAEFIAGPLSNGVRLSALMDELGSDAFLPTQQHKLRGRGNTNPRMAYRQQPAVQLTMEGIAWLNERLESALTRHGRVPAATLDRFGWGQIA